MPINVPLRKVTLGFPAAVVLITLLFVFGSSSALIAGDLEKLNDEELSHVTGEEGVRLNLNLNLSLKALNLKDGDGAGGTGGVFQLGSGSIGAITIDNGIGLRAELDGFTFDSSGDNEINFGLPSGDFTAFVDRIYFSDPDGPGMGPLTLEDVDFGQTNLKVSPN